MHVHCNRKLHGLMGNSFIGSFWSLSSCMHPGIKSQWLTVSRAAFCCTFCVHLPFQKLSHSPLLPDYCGEMTLWWAHGFNNGSHDKQIHTRICLDRQQPDQFSPLKTHTNLNEQNEMRECSRASLKRMIQYTQVQGKHLWRPMGTFKTLHITWATGCVCVSACAQHAYLFVPLFPNETHACFIKIKQLILFQ